MKADISIKQIQKTILPILKRAGVTRSAIFGSYVRGENKKDSDIDILVEPPKRMGLLDFIDLQLKLEKALNKKVDLVEYSTLKPRLRDYILNKQIQIL